MYIKKIEYTDLNGSKRRETIYFNLSPAEVLEIEMEYSHLEEGFSQHLNEIKNSGDGKLIMKTFKDLISRSYGIKSPDGRGFQKSDEITQNFLGSMAYSEFFVELMSDPDRSAVDFVNGIMPANLEETVRKMVANNTRGESSGSEDAAVTPIVQETAVSQVSSEDEPADTSRELFEQEQRRREAEFNARQQGSFGSSE